MVHHRLWCGGWRPTTWQPYFQAHAVVVTAADQVAADERAQRRFGSVQSAILHAESE